MNFIFIADSFVGDGYVGGSELCNHELIIRLRERGHNVVELLSFFASKNLIEHEIKNGNDTFIIGNFLGLADDAKRALGLTKYFIYEHDHKYLRSRDPSYYNYEKAPEGDIIYKDFYKSAYKVVGQSTRHCNIIRQNLGLDNIIVSNNIWDRNSLQNLRDYQDSDKQYDAAILDHIFAQKNTAGAEEYCRNNGLNYIKIPHGTEHREYCRQLALARNLVFLPQVNETLSRVSIEAHCLNTELITNNNISYLDEDWSKLRGKELIDFIDYAGNRTVDIFES